MSQDFVIEGGVLKKYTGKGGDVVIPEGVTSIGELVFYKDKTITSITLPKGMKRIGVFDFLGCSSLSSVTIPNSITDIELGAFKECSNLKIIRSPIMISWQELHGKNSFILQITGKEKNSFYAFVSKANSDNLSDFIKHGQWDDYDNELINNGPKYKYCLSIRLVGAIGRLLEPKKLSKKNRALFLGLISKNIKKVIPIAEELQCPELVKALFDLGLVNNENEVAIRKLLRVSQRPEIALFATAEKRDDKELKRVAAETQENVKRDRSFSSISELKKVQLLEKAVLDDSPSEVQALFEEYKTFEFTARALGYASRYIGLEMVNLLLDKGVTFQYKDVPTFARKYNYLVKYSNNTKVPMDYALMLLPDYKNIRHVWRDDIDKKPISESERVDVIRSIAKKESDSLGSVLYYSIIMEDPATYEALYKAGINKLTGWFDDVVTGKEGMNYSFNWITDRELLLQKLFDADIRIHKTILRQLLESTSTDKWRLFPSDFNGFGNIRSKRINRCCTVELFDFYYNHTNLADKVSRDELFRELTINDNANGLAKVLEHYRINSSQYSTMFNISLRQGKTEVTAFLMNYKNANRKLTHKTNGEHLKT